MENGFIKIHRKMMDWEWWHDAEMVRAWLCFLMLANWKDKKWRGVLIKKGQFVTGRFKLSQILRRSERSTRTIISRLKSTSELTSRSTNKFTIYTIVNYDKYQPEYLQTTSRSTNRTKTNDQQTTTTEEREERKEYKKKNAPLALKEFNRIHQAIRLYGSRAELEYKYEATIAALQQIGGRNAIGAADDFQINRLRERFIDAFDKNQTTRHKEY